MVENVLFAPIGVHGMADNAPTVTVILLYLPKAARTRTPSASARAGQSEHATDRIIQTISHSLFYTTCPRYEACIPSPNNSIHMPGVE